MKVALFGYGYWGKKVYRQLCQMFPASQVVVVDPFIKKKQKDILFYHMDQAFKDKKIQNCFIIVPEEIHYSLTKKCLLAGKNVFVEKPLCFSRREAFDLKAICEQKKLRVYVDNIFLFDPSVDYIKMYLNKNYFGDIKKVSSVRFSQDIFKPNITVFEDLAPHDIYLLSLFEKQIPISVSVHDLKVKQNVIQEGIVKYFLEGFQFEGKYSWLRNKTKRKMVIEGEKASMEWEKRLNQSDLITIKSIDGEVQNQIKVDKTISPLEKSIKAFLNRRKLFPIKYIDQVSMLELIRATYSTF